MLMMMALPAGTDVSQRAVMEVTSESSVMTWWAVSKSKIAAGYSGEYQPSERIIGSAPHDDWVNFCNTSAIIAAPQKMAGTAMACQTSQYSAQTNHSMVPHHLRQ